MSPGKRSMVIFALLALSGPGAAAPASAAIAWSTHKYEGDVMPAAATPAWFDSGGGEFSQAGGLLTQNTTEGSFHFFRMDPPSWNGDSVTGSTLEARVRVNSIPDTADLDSDAGTRISFGTSTRFWEFWIDATEVRLNTGPALPFTASRVVAVNTSQFHSYGFQLDQVNSTVDLFIDSVLALNDIPAQAGGLNNIYFGDLDTQFTGGNADYDYIRWTNAGIFEIPEPGAAGVLVVLAGLIALRSKRAV